MDGDQVAVWARPERGTRGPAPTRSRSEITTAAIELADTGGLESVSMRQVAKKLGTGPASLYRYVGNRDDLVDLMADAVTGEIDLSAAPTGDWRADLVALAVQAKAVYLRHPWLLEVMSQRTPLGPRSIDYLEHALGVLESAPASDRAKFEAIGILSGLVRLFAGHELSSHRAGTTPSAGRAAQTAYLAQVAAEGNHPRLLAALTSTADDRDFDPDALFERVLRRVLTGLLGGPDAGRTQN